MKTSDSIFLRALNKESLKIPPIWYMRQAGRYMPEYRAVRRKFKNFLDMCKNPEVCCELALQPINAFNLDASILFSDILTIPDAFGLGVEFLEGEGPVFNNPIKTSKDITNLPEERIKVHTTYIGGGFGGRFRMWGEDFVEQAVLLSKKLRKYS